MVAPTRLYSNASDPMEEPRGRMEESVTRGWRSETQNQQKETIAIVKGNTSMNKHYRLALLLILKNQPQATAAKINTSTNNLHQPTAIMFFTTAILHLRKELFIYSSFFPLRLLAAKTTSRSAWNSGGARRSCWPYSYGQAARGLTLVFCLCCYWVSTANAKCVAAGVVVVCAAVDLALGVVAVVAVTDDDRNVRYVLWRMGSFSLQSGLRTQKSCRLPIKTHNDTRQKDTAQQSNLITDLPWVLLKSLWAIESITNHPSNQVPASNPTNPLQQYRKEFNM